MECCRPGSTAPMPCSSKACRFRDIDTFAIDGFWLATFFGGGDDTWNATKDEYLYFDDFVISTERIEQ